MEKYENTTSSLKYYLKYIWTNILISFKVAIEYKTNLYFILLLSLTFTVIPLSFGYILIENFGSAINWTFKDFLIFYFFQDFFITFISLFFWKRISSAITTGDLQQFLNRPGNSLSLYSFHISGHSALIYGLIDIIIFIPIFFLYFNISPIYFLSAFLVGLIFSILSVSIVFLTYSICLYSLHVGSSAKNVIHTSMRFFRTYPGILFSNVKHKEILFILTSFVISFYCVNIIKYESLELFHITHSLIAFGVTLLLFYISYKLWNKGLRRYTAFS